MSLPARISRIHGVAFSGDGTLWVGAREGVYLTRDRGKTWLWVNRLPLGDVEDVNFDARLGKILVSSRSNDGICSIDPKTLLWTYAPTGSRINLARAAGGRLLAASLDDGVLIEPRAAGVETVTKEQGIVNRE